MSVLAKQIIKLNRQWQAFSLVSVRDAITMLCSETNGDKPGYALDFLTVRNEAGELVLEYANPVAWDEWIKLEVRPGDFVIETSRGPIRCPLAVICANYSKVPMKKPKLGKEAILRRDGYVCQYSGQKLPRSRLNIDHVKTRDSGGKDSWDNMVACDREINFRKGNKTNAQAGLTLIRDPFEPLPSPAVVRVQDLPEESREALTPFVLK